MCGYLFPPNLQCQLVHHQQKTENKSRAFGRDSERTCRKGAPAECCSSHRTTQDEDGGAFTRKEGANGQSQRTTQAQDGGAFTRKEGANGESHRTTQAEDGGALTRKEGANGETRADTEIEILGKDN